MVVRRSVKSRAMSPNRSNSRWYRIYGGAVADKGANKREKRWSTSTATIEMRSRLYSRTSRLRPGPRLWRNTPARPSRAPRPMAARSPWPTTAPKPSSWNGLPRSPRISPSSPKRPRRRGPRPRRPAFFPCRSAGRHARIHRPQRRVHHQYRAYRGRSADCRRCLCAGCGKNLVRRPTRVHGARRDGGSACGRPRIGAA